MSVRSALVLLGTLLVVAVPLDVCAQVNSLSSSVSPDESGFLALPGTVAPGAGRFSALAVLGYAHQPADAGTSHRLSMQAGVSVGVGERGALQATWPFVLLQTDARETQALADLSVSYRYRLVGNGTTRSRMGDGPGFALQGTVSFPTGDERVMLGEDGATAALDALGDFQLFGLGLGANLGFRHRFLVSEVAGVRLRDEWRLGVAVKVPLPWVAGLSAFIELKAIADALWDVETRLRNSMTVDVGVRYGLEDFTFLASAQFGLVRGYGTPDGQATIALRYTPRSADIDGDGIPDAADSCPFLPEDGDGYEDDDGCLDPDNDNDFVPDVDDRCPDAEALEGRDADEDGCTDPFG